jgi:hypothetical protein
MAQLKAQEDTNANILLALASLQQSINASANSQEVPSKKEVPPKKEKKTETKGSKNVKAVIEESDEDAMEVATDCIDDITDNVKIGRYRVRTRIPEWYASNVEDILTDQYQRSRESIENSRHESQYFNNMSRLKKLNSLFNK